jgi:hypothetical protein
VDESECGATIQLRAPRHVADRKFRCLGIESAEDSKHLRRGLDKILGVQIGHAAVTLPESVPVFARNPITCSKVMES